MIFKINRMFKKITFNFVFLFGLVFLVGGYQLAFSAVDTDLPSTPIDVKATKISSDSVKIEWGKVLGVQGYDVMRT